MTFRILYLLVLAMISQVGQSQTKKAFLKAATEKYSEKDYYSALSYYGEALAFDSTDLEVRYNLAESARKFNAYTTAAAQYSYLLDADSTNIYPDASLRLGQMWMMLGNYDEAINLYNIYLGEHSGEDASLDSLASQGVENANYAKEKLANSNPETEVARIPDGVNTPYSEFAGRGFNDQLFYTSHSDTYESKEWGEVLLGRMLRSEDHKEGAAVSIDHNIEGKSIANATFSKDSLIVLSLCEYINSDDLRCDLYTTTFTSDSSFSSLSPLPFNSKEATTTQPYLVDKPDGRTDLYFVSDRAGGKGQKDIYLATLQQDNSWSAPINLADINTSGNDISPSYSITDGRLYWSTDGRLSLGGYDIYSARLFGDGSYEDIYHLDSPVNSSFNDIYYTIQKQGDRAYFSSNRTGSLYIEPGQEACCYDIYEAQFAIVDINLLAKTYDLLTRDSLTGVTVSLYDANTGRLIKENINEEGKDHDFSLLKGRDYLLVSSRDGYYNDTTEISTAGIDGPIETTIYLDRDGHALEVLTFDKRTTQPLIGTEVRLIDLSDNSIADIVQLNDEGHDFLFVLEPDKNYRIEASKDGFITASEEITTIGDGVTKRMERQLYLDSFDLNLHLPVNLYFANDRPNPGSRSTSTKKTYTSLYIDYIADESAYKRRNPAEKEELAQFFSESVKGGYTQLQKFYAELLKAMESGEEILLTLKGHTSPLAANKYNLVLGQRRVESVKNDIARYQGGVLKKYLENGQIVVKDISYGEEISERNVSDQSSNKRNSIYSVDAARERRVEIIKATKQ